MQREVDEIAAVVAVGQDMEAEYRALGYAPCEPATFEQVAETFGFRVITIPRGVILLDL